MFIDKAIDEFSKRNKVVIGFELGHEYSQISYCRADQSMPDTLSMVMGEEQYNIPTLLCGKPEGDGHVSWTIGSDAVKNASEGNGVLADRLVELAENQGSVRIGGEVYGAKALLEIYIRKSLSLLSAHIRQEDIGAVAFTMDEMQPGLMQTIREAMQNIPPKKAELYFLSHEDCFFQYIIHQPQEMWIHDVLLYDYTKTGIKSHILQLNRNTNPVACFIETDNFLQMSQPDIKSMGNDKRAELYRQLDSKLLEISRGHCEERVVTSVFLLGDYFSKDWCRESLRYLCRGRRVFQGNNLFSKGACYGARERMLPSTLSGEYIYLSDDKLRANIGMKCDRGQEEIYFPILNAGTSWYDVAKEFDVMLVKNNTLSLTITPIDGSRTRIANISLEGLSVRGNKTNRIGLKFYMNDPQAVWIEVKDKGFGEIFPSTGKLWRECLPIEVIS